MRTKPMLIEDVPVKVRRAFKKACARRDALMKDELTAFMIRYALRAGTWK